jgi:hypothetical protein
MHAVTALAVWILLTAALLAALAVVAGVPTL